MPMQNVVFWNTIVLGHVKYGEGQKARYGIKHYHLLWGFQMMVYKIDVPTTWITHNILKFPLRHIFLVNLIFI